MKKIIICTVCLLVVLTGAFGSSPDYTWALGLSGIAPGLPVAVKGVWQSHGWGVQVEANYFYALGMVRIDGRRMITTKGPWSAYGFVGVTANHFNDGTDINNTLWADVGAAGTVKFGKNRRFEIGMEGGLLIPFYSNMGLEQYEDTGFMVANLFALWWW
ncbi:MAG: hypothetical protein VB025_08145 [Sphaerochaeta sp.]|nr:hypothetical protein [Sphaerochaeta sp.]PKL27834.1 MAG: hypothetical protein CVV46_09450 [Spirochaetae bacterium HGW-Spirochaetae-2]